MTANEIYNLSKLHTRDIDSALFTEDMFLIFLNEGIDKVRSFKPLVGMNHVLSVNDTINIIPDEYHYMFALWCACRFFDYDERFYEASEKRTEFESVYQDLTSSINNGKIVLYDDNGNEISIENNNDNPFDYVKDVYFKKNEEDETIRIINP